MDHDEVRGIYSHISISNDQVTLKTSEPIQTFPISGIHNISFTKYKTENDYGSINITFKTGKKLQIYYSKDEQDQFHELFVSIGERVQELMNSKPAPEPKQKKEFKPNKAATVIMIVAIAIFILYLLGSGGKGSKSTVAANATSTPEATPPFKVYNPGEYKVGTDITAGEYLFINATNGSTGYYALSSDANGSNIIANDNFSTSRIVTIEDGQYLELARAYGCLYEDYENSYGTLDTTLSEGIFKIGTDLPAGEYTLKSISSGSYGYYEIRNSSAPGTAGIEKNNNFTGTEIVDLSDGQYLTIKDCTIVK